jgi:23S rRNA (guanosine2251-2'-O)-methyltransferase
MNKETDFIFGMRPVIEAIKAGKQIDKLLVKKGLRGELYHELMEAIHDSNVPWQIVPQEKLDYITRKNHQGVIAWLSLIEFQNIENILPSLFEGGAEPLIIVLDGVSDVRNFGAIVRTAACFGAHTVIIPEKSSARITGDAVKASAGALNTFPICRVKSITKCVNYLKDSGLKVISATEKSDTSLNKAQLTGPIAIIIGSEDRGISHELLEMSDLQVAIPMEGNIGSLNVSVSSGVLLYEIKRQRQ